MMKRMWSVLAVSFVCGLCLAQDDTNAVPEVEWIDGPATGELERISTLSVPEGYSFTDSAGTRIMMESMGNLVSDSHVGMILAPSNEWFAVFSFEACGYVKDDEKNSLDADKILQSLREGLEEANSQRRVLQVSELEIDGWYKEPFYNEATHNLEWCTQIREKGTDEPFANYKIKILGRHGVTDVILVADLDQLDTAVPALAKVLEGYKYTSGGSYAEYRKGDKIAKYGLTALVAGGAAAVALKSGLLAKLWKPIAGAALAAGAFFKRMFGKKSQ